MGGGLPKCEFFTRILTAARKDPGATAAGIDERAPRTAYALMASHKIQIGSCEKGMPRRAAV